MYLFSIDKLVKDTMSRKFMMVNKSEKLEKAIKIMLDENLREVFISNDVGMLMGVISLTDISKIENREEKQDEAVEKFIRRKELITVSKTDSLEFCRNLMIEKNIGRLPVIEDTRIIGVVREKEIRDYFYMGIEVITEKLNTTINNIHEGVCAVDQDGKVILWNESAEKLYNVPSEKVIGKNLKEYFPDAIMLEILKTKKPVSNRYHSPKENSYVVISAVPIIVNGEFLGVVSSERDVTEVKNLSSELRKANTTLRFLKGEVKKFSNENFGNIIGQSDELLKQIEVARQVAETEAAVLMAGESGTGKEVFARAVHDESGRSGLFVPVNCSAIPSGLFESEFFGYEEGAFTGAKKRGKMGVVELANNGTLFLDEIGDMPLFMQAKLLRLLQEKEFRRVGGEKNVTVNIRVISATNKDLKEMVSKGEFREDLYYRINVVEIYLPPLRKRKGDVAILIYHFLNEICEKYDIEVPEIREDVISTLESYSWEGNIRELKNTVERLVIMSKENIIKKEAIPEYILSKVNKKNKVIEYPLDLNEAKKKIEIDTINKALKIAKGNKVKAAHLLNVPRSTLYYKMENYGIETT